MLKKIFTILLLSLIFMLLLLNQKFTVAQQIPSQIYLPLITLNARQPGVFGAHLQQITPEYGLYQAHALTSSWTRRNIAWAVIEPQPNVRAWSTSLENEFIAAANAQIQVIGLIVETPQWATGKETGCGPVAPEYLDDFAAFMGDVVARYSQPPYNIHVWELWNEPDVAGGLGCWGNTADPYYGGGYYAQMLAQVYPAIKAADSRAQVLVGGLLLDCDPNTPPPDPNNPEQPKDCSPARFFEGILRAGGGNFFDGVSFHGYDFYQGELGRYGMINWNARWDTTGPILVPKAQYLNGLMTQYYVADKYLVDTEIGLICGTDGTQPPCLTPEFETTKAIYLAQAFAAARANNVQIGIWYNLTGWSGSGLLNTNLQPLPAYTAFQTAQKFLSAKNYQGQNTPLQSINPLASGYAFQNSATNLWVVWSSDGQTHTVQLPSIPIATYDLYGNLQTVNSTSLNLTQSPQYVFLRP